MNKYEFKSAVPVWQSEKENEMNYNIAFRSVIKKSRKCVVAVSASNMYQMFVNGEIASEGPARAGHGYYRVDEIDISDFLTNDENIVCIYVDGYNVPNFYLVKQPAFLCAEIIADGNIAAATGVGGFDAKYHDERLRKVVRYSVQRTFTEVYSYKKTYRSFERDINCTYDKIANIAPVEHKNFICRDIPYPCYRSYNAVPMYAGRITPDNSDTEFMRDRVLVLESPDNGFDLDEVELIPCDDVQKYKFIPENDILNSSEPITIGEKKYAMYNLPREKTGFITLDIECDKNAKIMIVFDEVLSNGDIDLKRSYPGNTVINCVTWYLESGRYSLITNEPYTFKYIKLINFSNDSNIKINSIGLTGFENAAKIIPLSNGSEQLKRIYNAAFETYIQNTVDIYTDCPSRERAGWLCDSFFTARTEHFLTGKSEIEHNFLENFIFTKSEIWNESPMLPMCYPADGDGFIPQWAMWYILELSEYLDRSGNAGFVAAAKNKVTNLMSYFEKYENSDGLLENLDGWNFVEWSKANDFVSGVNFPTNMLYAMTLRTADVLYPGNGYAEKAKSLTETICKMSYINGFFHDQALRNETNVLYVTDSVTETCQYYAFFTGVATCKTHADLLDKLVSEFGRKREKTGLYKEIYPSNAFIGYFLRLEILAQNGYISEMLQDIEDYFLPMADTTGTLWEMNSPSASCNHGFASYIMVLLNKYI